ncbi:MAG: ROK family protein [Verrucomicrobiota bacterium]
MKNKYWVGFDLGGTKMLAKIFNHSGEKSLASVKNPTEGARGAKAGLSRIVETIEEALDKAKIDKSDLAGIGIACPGPIDPDNGVLIEAPNLGWNKVPVQATLEKAFKCPAAVANDVDLGTYGEYVRGAAQGARCAVGIFPGTGIGGGAVINGELLQGAGITCMEIGHIPISGTKTPFASDRYTTLETVASRLAISAAATQAAYRGQAPHLYESCGTDLAKIKSGKLASAIKNGDEAIEHIVRKAARALGEGVATAVLLLAPDVIVIGGGLVTAMTDLYVEEVTDSARRHVLPAYRDRFKVVPAQLDDDATVIGAVGWAQHKIG